MVCWLDKTDCWPHGLPHTAAPCRPQWSSPCGSYGTWRQDLSGAKQWDSHGDSYPDKPWCGTSTIGLATASSLSASKGQTVACSGWLLSKARVAPAPKDSGDASRPGGGARKAAERLGVGGGRWGKLVAMAARFCQLTAWGGLLFIGVFDLLVAEADFMQSQIKPDSNSWRLQISMQRGESPPRWFLSS
jgi:hypothetical protein